MIKFKTVRNTYTFPESTETSDESKDNDLTNN